MFYTYFTMVTCFIRLIRQIIQIFSRYQLLVNTHQVGRKRNIVRHLGSVLPLKQPTRICLVMTTEQDIVNFNDISLEMEHFLNESDVFSKESLNPTLSLSKPDVVADTENSSVESTDYNKLLTLEQEIKHLKCLMEQILLQHCSSGSCIGDGSSDPASVLSLLLPSAPPPPPPPPPPPLPPSSLICNMAKNCHVNKPITKSKKEIEDFKEVLPISLEAIKKIKLRPVERTSTGSPIRHRPYSTDSSSILGAILKKRYAAAHIDSPERNNSHTESEFDYVGEE